MEEHESVNVREQFLRHLTKVVSGAVRQCQDAHGSVEPGSVGKRVAAHLWGETKPEAWADAAQFMRHARGQLGLSQVAIAVRLGVQQNVISNWEKGKHRPQDSELAAVSAMLGQLGLQGG